MQKDFHYYCIAVLARAAGFPPADALTIAYASQYVDDATESEPIDVGDLVFDPVRTSHVGLKAYDWAVQKRVYIPFHFLPPAPLRHPTDPFVVAPNSSFAYDLVDTALKEKNPDLRLFRIGIALHTFADTWAHRGFSGRRHEENNVEALGLFFGSWEYHALENLYFDLLPKIGHAQAAHYPDIPFLQWRYTDSFGRVVERDNAKEFASAAKEIYGLLRNGPSTPEDSVRPWDEIDDDVCDCLALTDTNLGERCAMWRIRFSDFFGPLPLRYDKLAWRTEALEPRRGRDIEWDRMSRRKIRKLRFNRRRGFYGSRWVQFHRAALLQRHFVLERLL